MKILAIIMVPCIIGLAVVGTSEAPIAIIFGWIAFAGDVAPKLSVDWPTVAVAFAAVALFVAGVHWVARTWRLRQASEPGQITSRWKLRWSLAMVAAIFLLFTAGLGIIGLVHQTAWLLDSKRPLLSQASPAFGGYNANPINNLKTIGLGLHSYEGTYRKLPSGGTFTPEGEMLHSWETHLLPYIGYYERDLDMKVAWNSANNRRYFESIIPEFINPSFRTVDIENADGYGLSHFAVNVQIMAANKSMRLDDITDGTSTTVLAGEVNDHFKPWGHPVNWRDLSKGINRSPEGFGGPPGKGGVFSHGRCVGSIRERRSQFDSAPRHWAPLAVEKR